MTPKNIQVKITSKENKYENYIRVAIPHLKTEIPLFIVFRALGCDADKEICDYILDKDGSTIDNELLKLLKMSITESSDIFTQMEATIIEVCAKLVTEMWERTSCTCTA